MTLSLKLTAACAGSLLCCGVAAAASSGPRLSTPSSARVGQKVTARASGLRPARYALTLSLDNTAGPRTACVARVGKQRDAVHGRVTVTGHIPAHLRCWENDSVRLGRVAVKPGKYHLIVGHPDGPSGFGPGSFVRRKLTIKR